jgi:outer membrane receptor protein involved in Fe transport
MTTIFKLNPLSLALLALASECAVFSAQAQTTPSQPAPTQTTQFDEVVVSGSRSISKLSETPVSIGAVKSEQWEKDKPKSIGEIINRIPGVKWNDLGNEQHSMSIRQPISTNAVYQYLEDGIPIRPLGVFNHNALNETNMNASGGVEVVKGAASSLYGSNAVGGAINFLTKRPSKTPTGTLGVRYDGTDKFARIDTAASNTWGDLGLAFSQYSSRRDSVNWQNYSGGQKDAVSVRGDYEISGTSWLRASIIRTDLNSEMTGSLFETDYRNNPSKSINTFTYRKDKATRSNLAWEGETTTGGVTTATLFTRSNDHGQIPSYTIGSCVGLNCKGTINNNHVDSLGVDIKHEQKLDWSRAKLVSGVYLDRSKNTYVSDNLAIVRDGAGVYRSYTTLAVQLGRRDYSAGILNNAVFSQLEFNPTQNVRIVAGGRYDGISYDFKNNLTPGVNYGAADEVRTFGRFSPKVGVTLAVNETNSLYTNLSGGFKPPEVSELYGKSAIPDLRASTYVNAEVGWRAVLGGGIKLDSALYQLSGDDTVVSYTISPGNSENRNAGQTRSRGLELGLSYDEKALDWRVGWAYAEHKFLTYTPSATLDYSGFEMPQAPRHNINASVGYKVAPGARVALAMVYQGEYWMNTANTARYAGHVLFNLQGSYNLPGGVEAWVQLRNLTDAKYSDSASSSYSGTGAYNPDTQNTYSAGAPRSMMIGITKTFGGK